MNKIPTEKNEKYFNTEYREYKYFLPKITSMKIPYGDHARNSFDGQLPARSREVIYCKKCVVSNQRPRIVFDEKGVCSACNYAEYKNSIDWDKRGKEFEILCDKYRRNDGRWDVVVPCSGGKDSGALAHRLKYVHGMHPLCITWSPMMYANIGMQNLQNMISSGLDNLLTSPNRVLQRKLSKLGIVLVGNHHDPFGRGIMCRAFHVAIKEDIKLIMFGENAELEYGGDTKNKDIPYNPYKDWDKYYFKNTSFEKLLKFGFENGYLTKEDTKEPSLKWYTLPPIEEIKEVGVVPRWYSWYFNWIPQENYYYASENYGFQAMPRRTEATYSKYASIDDLTDPWHYYMMLIKFGIGRATSDASHEIRDGHLTREEGVTLVRRFDCEFPTKTFKVFLEYLDVTEEEFWDIINGYRSISPHLWEQVNGEWKLKHQVS
ncbi:MAG TPA: N-acetyl sugar amidotransferase [Candidatus Wujingus californicus]|uniref:N-acetyl sugar amidotransferase n=1 Tax=Candidatus Wujingus californicus TaxID=3367618 RepID=UPI002713BC19|nr:N-acetyl sugar amidotransferase [Candidatus Brocadiales bacterium]